MEEEFKFAVTIKKKSNFNNINEIDQTIALTFQCHYKDQVENFIFLEDSRISLILIFLIKILIKIKVPARELEFTWIVLGANFVKKVGTAKFWDF